MPEIISGTGHSYKTIGERAEGLIGRKIYRNRLYGRIVRVDLVWGNFARLTLKLTDGTFVCLVNPVSI